MKLLSVITIWAVKCLSIVSLKTASTNIMTSINSVQISPDNHSSQSNKEHSSPPNYSEDISPAERCRKTVLRGPCTNWTHKWYYNESLHVCLTFVYGGCYGENIFDSEAECLHYCIGGDHTLPPPFTDNQHFQISNSDHLSKYKVSTNLPVISNDEKLNERGIELTFLETGKHKVFMMAKSNAFIQLDGDRIPTFQLRLCREISFQFRTRLPHGLLVYHSIKNRPDNLEPYALYVIVEKGQLKVVHVFGKHSTSVIVGEGLNRDFWHSVTVTIDVHGARLIAKVDDQVQETFIQGLHPSTNYGVVTDLTSVVLIGGLSPEEKLHGVKYIIESFVGCIKNMVLSAGKAASDLLPIKPLIATKHINVQEGCINKCRTRENLCFVGSVCINHYNHLSCDCFGTNYEGELCDIYTATILTFRGSSYVSYRVYDWKDRVHSSSNRISFHFKTRFDDSALFYASGETPSHHHIAVSIVNETVIVDANLGGGTVIKKISYEQSGLVVNDNHWHNLTIVHVNSTMTVYLDSYKVKMDLPGIQYHLYIDPEVYLGGGPELNKRKGLTSLNNYVGSMKYVFFNDVSILYELNKTNPKVHYIGVLEPQFSDSDISVIPMTFPFPSSHFWWPINPNSLELIFEFKSSKAMAVLASSQIISPSSSGFWELRLVNEELRFELVPDVTKNFTHLTTVKYDNKGIWHTVELAYSNGEVRLATDFKHKQTQIFGINILLGDKIIIGSSYSGKANIGIVGCMREIVINSTPIDPRYIVRTNYTDGQVSLDNCELVDPCKRPNACEHNGKCLVKDDRLSCDCNGTGYIGKNCHFAKFRKTCEELALLGYTKPDLYLIDIDGNGRFPPAHVKCEFQSLEDSTKTIVEHNLPSQVDVRSAKEGDFSFAISYREFTSEMLQELISHSLYCSQHIKYDCYKAPLELHSATWFVAAANNGTVDYIGNAKRGSCPCAENRTCVSPNQSCNCDISDAKWLSDEGYYINPNSLGITEMVFLQQKELEEDALGRITLGPLECVETNTQKYVVTFTTSQSYIEVPGWRKGDIAFSFRTTGEKAILLFQPPIRPHHPSFMVALTSDFQLTFNFTLNTGRTRELEIKSQRKLNSGEWQKIWIDYNEHHVRFMINTDYQMVDLLPEEEFGPFEGSMFIGGATEELIEKCSVRQGLIGCFRGLVVNGEILDIYSYMSVHLSEIIKDCKPSCDPNPCKNGARCKELWSKFQCVCENPWAYIGIFCEKNINEDGMTLVTRDSLLKRSFLSNDPDIADISVFKDLLTESILVNLRTYDHNALILHANDHLNNFIQLFINNSNFVLLFNHGEVIKNLTIYYPDVSNGKSVQVAIIRMISETWLHVNEKNISSPIGVNLLTNYSFRPWTNPEKEVLAPQRPPAPPTEYFQVNIGGYDDRLLFLKPLDGYIGCIRGLKIGEQLVSLAHYVSKAINDSGAKGLISGCHMKCDEQPCKNQGVCIEDFLKAESSCDCEYTSYYGEFCGQEKGADLGGDSLLLRKFPLDGMVYQVKIQLAFSSSDDRLRNTVLLLLQTGRSYYLLVAIGAEGELIFEEDREGSAFGVRIRDRYFLNGARHSLYYKRNNDITVLMVDRSPVQLAPIPVLSLSDVPDGNHGFNEVQIGGLNTTDPRFAAYTGYIGCLSNVVIEVNNVSMRPLDEYMLFTKTGSEEVIVKNSQGIRSAQCSFFDEIHKPRPGPTLNISFGHEGGQWVEDPPDKIPYKSLYSDPATIEEGTGRALFIVAIVVFCVIIFSSIYHVYRNHLSYKKRKEVDSGTYQLWRSSNGSTSSQTSRLANTATATSIPILEKTGQITITPIKAVRSRSVCNGDVFNGRPYQPLDSPIRPALKLTRSKSQDDTMKPHASNLNGNDKQPYIKLVTSTVQPSVRFRIPAEEDKIESPDDYASDEEVNLKNKMIEPKDSDVMAMSHYTINEDSAGEREEESELEENRRPLSLDLGQTFDPVTLFSGSTTSIKSAERRKSLSSRLRNLFSPVYFDDSRRTFANPMSYLGAPLRRIGLSRTTLKSQESVMSLD